MEAIVTTRGTSSACSVHLVAFFRRLATCCRSVCVFLVQVNDLYAGWLVENELIVSERLVQVQLAEFDLDVKALNGTRDVHRLRKEESAIVFEGLIGRISNHVPLRVIDELPVRQQVNAAEDDLS